MRAELLRHIRYLFSKRLKRTPGNLSDSLVLVLPCLMARIEMFLLLELFCLKSCHSLPWAKLLPELLPIY